jgi:lipid II:glycine glycyltransferase (peptidoglycan interpeptide bridge formation enzyme)
LNIEIVKTSDNFKEWLSIFGTEEFLQTKSDNYGWFVSDSFILPFYIDKRAIFSKLVFTTNIVVVKEGNEELFLDKVVVKSKELNIDLIAQPLASAVFKSLPKDSRYIAWGSWIVNLELSEDELLKNIHSKHRNVIKKAMKDGVVIEETEDINIIFNMIKETMHRQNRAYVSKNEIANTKKFSKFYIAKKEGVIQGCAVVAFNNLGAYYLHGGSIARPHTGSLNYMHYYTMLELKKLGVKKYDFMGARPNVEKGTKLEGIQRFKSRFGGELHNGYLWKYELKPLKVLLMIQIQKMLFRLKSQHYLGDAIEQELLKCEK